MQRIWIFHTDAQRASVFTRAFHKLLRAHEQRALQKRSRDVPVGYIELQAEPPVQHVCGFTDA